MLHIDSLGSMLKKKTMPRQLYPCNLESFFFFNDRRRLMNLDENNFGRSLVFYLLQCAAKYDCLMACNCKNSSFLFHLDPVVCLLKFRCLQRSFSTFTTLALAPPKNFNLRPFKFFLQCKGTHK